MTWDFPSDRAAKRHHLLDGVEKVRPTLLAGVDEAEAAYTLPTPSFDALYEAGLFWLEAPRIARWG